MASCAAYLILSLSLVTLASNPRDNDNEVFLSSYFISLAAVKYTALCCPAPQVLYSTQWNRLCSCAVLCCAVHTCWCLRPRSAKMKGDVDRWLWIGYLGAHLACGTTRTELEKVCGVSIMLRWFHHGSGRVRSGVLRTGTGMSKIMYLYLPTYLHT